MKKQVILMSLAIAGLLCCIPMFVLNAPGAPGLSGGAASLLGMAGAVLFGTCAGTLLQLKRLSRDPDYRQRQKAQCDERNQAIRDRAGYLAAEHLIKLGRGELALVYGGDQAAISREYRAGVVDCCLEYGARLRGSHIYEVDFLNSGGALPAIADRLADSPSRPDGLLAIDDQIAAELIRLLQARNRRVPQDIAVVGCNNSEIASLNSPSITTIEIPTFALGQLAAREIISRIGGTAENHAPLEVKLLAGESTAVAAK